MAALTHIALWTTQLETLRDFYVHVRSKEEVDRQVELFRRDGYVIAGEPRTSGDGYYEGVILDPDGNRVELVAFGEPEIIPATYPPYPLLLDADPDQAKVDAVPRNSEKPARCLQIH